jgi:hypothetical protein
MRELKRMIPKSLPLDSIRGWNRFSEEIMRQMKKYHVDL